MFAVAFKYGFYRDVYRIVTKHITTFPQRTVVQRL